MNSTLVTRRILLVDDHAAIHDDLRKMLAPPDAAAEKARRALLDFLGDAPPVIARARSFEFADATQGEQAVEVARAAHESGKPFDLAIVDMRMPPGIDGLETAARLRALQPGIAIVFCTAFSDHPQAAIVALLGSSGHAVEHKPLDPRRLRERVEELLRG
jgi:CheY-like chemotaxis protein